jgi:hypothetical protein
MKILNMKKLTRIVAYNALTLIIPALVWTACKDDETETLNLARRFKPTVFEIDNGETSATVAWSASLFTQPGEVEYQVEVSKDVNFTDVEYTATTAETHLTILDTEIDILTDYYARVKALGTGGTGDSNWLISEPFRITGEIFILPVAESDVVTDAAIIHWTPEQVLTKIVVTPTGGTSFEVSISPEEAAAGQKTISGLTASTSYTAEIFLGDVTKGSVTFTTKQSYAGSNIIDLRGITGKPKILVDTLPDIPSGSVIYLKRGQVYTVASTDLAAARNFSKSVTIVSGPDFISTFAKIELTTNFNIVANAVIDSLVFRDIIFKGARPNGASFDNDYVLNVNAVGTIGKVRIDNCKISRLRGIVRLQTGGAGAKIQNYFINKCLVDSIREFAVVMASAASSFTNVKISNSTFSKCRRFVNHSVPGNSTTVIENCTFNEVPSGGVEGAEANYFIDLNGNTTTSVTIINCILGKGWNEGAGEFVHGIRTGAGASVNVTNSYKTSDFLNTNATSQITGLLGFSSPSTSLFASPSTGNFTIVNASFPGATTAGDPRWRQ